MGAARERSKVLDSSFGTGGNCWRGVARTNGVDYERGVFLRRMCFRRVPQGLGLGEGLQKNVALQREGDQLESG